MRLKNGHLNVMTKKASKPELSHADILIVGGGLVGGVAARALGDAGFSVAVIDGEDPSTATAAGFDGRASAIAAASERLLSAIGIWPHLSKDVCPILDIRVADGQSPMFLHYDHDDVGLGPLGYLAENRHIRRAVLASLGDDIIGNGHIDFSCPHAGQ